MQRGVSIQDVEDADTNSNSENEVDEFDFVPLKRAFKNSLFSHRITPHGRHSDLLRFLKLLSKTVAIELR